MYRGITMYENIVEKLGVLFDYFGNINKSNEDNIRKFVETEYKQDDREWAYAYFKNKTSR
tara:strand:- start:559 stop:738 length:180 start_codon:yes stop_codon:yes gene_type:complete